MVARIGQCVVVEPVDLIAKQGSERWPSEALGVSQRRGIDPPPPARPAYPEDEVLDLERREGQLEGSRGTGQVSAGVHVKRALRAGVDPHLELVVLTDQ